MSKTNFLCEVDFSDFKCKFKNNKTLADIILENAKIKFEEEGYESVSIQLKYDSKHMQRVDGELVPSKKLEMCMSKILRLFCQYHDEDNKPKIDNKKWTSNCRTTYTFYLSNKKEE